MIDINLLRADKGGDPEIVRESQRKRGASVELVDEIIALDQEWVSVSFQRNQLRKEKNSLSKQFGIAKRNKTPTDELAAQISVVGKQLEELEAREIVLITQRDAKLGKVGNLVYHDVPVSQTEDDNEVVRTFGECRVPEEGETLLNHVYLLERLGATDTYRGSRTAGNRGYYLTGPGVMLNMALIQYGLQFLGGRGFTPVQTPFMMRKDAMAKVAQLEQFDEELYKVSGEGDDKYLIATSEQTICAFHMEETLSQESLPVRYAGYSTCFRKECGRHGIDTLGIFRIHQFEKIEQFMITDTESSWEAQSEMITNSEEFYQSLNIPYRVINIVSGELNNAAAKKLDLEAWFPGGAQFRELVSCSNCLDYQSRRLGIRSDKGKAFVHMLNSTLSATERTICAIVENNQTKDGVVVPEALRPFMGGVDFLPFVQVSRTEEKMKKEAKGKRGKK
ncbi:serine-tRNA ligase, type1 [Kipferlia bialata]|uniref:serine--tRNA ligase n=1 Tax=Kipferlia bialata TaxID=797122 RepID=A0A9K3D237_9EUKA|nr:serine-tRNA ligase, type1 [Kipferlia bialata]|eukprot:g8734.t1